MVVSTTEPAGNLAVARAKTLAAAERARDSGAITREQFAAIVASPTISTNAWNIATSAVKRAEAAWRMSDRSACAPPEARVSYAWELASSVFAQQHMEHERSFLERLRRAFESLLPF